MNIFFLDKDPTIAAQYNCDKHCVKIILETCQMLENKTWLNHPMTRWVNSCIANYSWTAHHAYALSTEYSFRYGKTHSWDEKIASILTDVCVNKWNWENMTDPPLCMPIECQTINYVESYRNYYLKHKRHLFKWTKREIPYWISEEKCQVVTV